MEQSPLSHSIRNLEAELRTTLFHRTTRRTWLTQAGARFYADARRILADVEAATAALKDKAANASRDIRLALGEYLAGETFTQMLFELEHRQPSTRVDISELAHADAIRPVQEGEADVAITIDGRSGNGLVQRRGWGEPLMAVVPLGHDLAERDVVGLSELTSERLAMPSASLCPGYVAQIETLFSRHGLSISSRTAVRHWSTAVSFASTGRVIALCPHAFINGTTSVAAVPVAETDAELVTWLHYSDLERSPAVALVLEIARLIDADRDLAGVAPLP